MTETSTPQKQQSIALNGTIALPDERVVPAYLCMTGDGAYLTTAHHGEVTVDLASIPADDLQYVSRTIGDRLIVNGQRFGLPFGKAALIREGIARARLLAAHGTPSPDHSAPAGPYVDSASPLEADWLAATVGDDDPVIAWMVTQSHHTFTESIGGARIQGPVRLLLTASQTMLTAVSRFGDVHVQVLPYGPIGITDNRLSRDQAQLGEHSWLLPMHGAERLQPLQRLTAMSRSPRLREAARLLAQRSEDGAKEQAVALLNCIQDAGPLDRLTLCRLTEMPGDDALQALLAELAARDSDAGRLADWARRWLLPVDDSRRLLSAAMAALEADRASWALPLHRHLREQLLDASRDLFEQAAADLELSAHLLVAGRKSEARSILEPRRGKLPNEDLLAVLPPPTADLTSGGGGQAMHIQILELLAAARGTDEAPDPVALAELARHQPLLMRRLRDLAEHAAPALQQRASAALAILKPGGLTASRADQPPPIVQGLDADNLELLQHPVARENGVFGQLQSALAKITPPDHGTLRDYCERVTPRRHRQLLEAISDACVAMNLTAVPAFISMGEKRIGIRSHEVPEPFLLIGGAHLDPEDEAYLEPNELRAAIAAEVAHIRFKHSRITSSDLWAGVWKTGTTALETTALVLPFLRFLPVNLLGKQRTYEVVSRVVPLSWLQRIYETENLSDLADIVTGDIGKIGNAASTSVDTAKGHLESVGGVAEKLLPAQVSKKQDVSLDGARILAAHRVMQITADRAALVLTGDLLATVRAMFLLHSRLQPELLVAERAGLHGCLARREGDGTPLLPDLTVRIAALIAFYLSDDYTSLRDRIAPASGEE